MFCYFCWLKHSGTIVLFWLLIEIKVYVKLPTGSTFGGGTTSAFGGFGGGAVGAQQAGTGHIKFNPVTGIS